MSYIETLIEVANTDQCPTSILLYCAEAMCKVLLRVDLVPPIKVQCGIKRFILYIIQYHEYPIR